MVSCKRGWGPPLKPSLTPRGTMQKYLSFWFSYKKRYNRSYPIFTPRGTLHLVVPLDACTGKICTILYLLLLYYRCLWLLSTLFKYYHDFELWYSGKPCAILDLLAFNPEFTTLVSLVKSADLVELLSKVFVIIQLIAAPILCPLEWVIMRQLFLKA